jgi:hypothetical protein
MFGEFVIDVLKGMSRNIDQQSYHFFGTSGRPAFQFGVLLFYPGKSGVNFFL